MKCWKVNLFAYYNDSYLLLSSSFPYISFLIIDLLSLISIAILIKIRVEGIANARSVNHFNLFCMSLVVFLKTFKATNALESLLFSESINLEYGAIQSLILCTLLCISLSMSFIMTVSIWEWSVSILSLKFLLLMHVEIK